MKFDRNGIRFSYPDSWKIAEESWADEISAITLESNNELIMIDIYHRKSNRSLKDYADLHFNYFVKNLPFHSNVSSGPKYSETNYGSIQGLTLEYCIRTWLLNESTYINPVFMHVCPNAHSFISAQYEKENGSFFNTSLVQILESFSVS